ncbi:nuclease A inhibitor-like protein [Pontibacter mucosus]|uniref:Nuclease A inhibitor-like protein n=1 Tax=Pontibacter mucosus TaxID=1649266 RepID=A0A2T5YE83_9BACT|nr:nuclease A inhibitor family protein [Pontibacter mucosus]PTX15022.1 nuclease A inhibitor-like protein [Pontibacter mucosus]
MSHNENTDAALKELRRLSEGLLYVSETDAPLEAVHFPASFGAAPTAREVAAWAGKEGTVENMELGTFFRPMITNTETTEDRETAARFQSLQAYLEQHLDEVKVYRIGRRRITALVLGRADTGDWIGVKTEVVET